MTISNRLNPENYKQQSLEEICQCLVWTTSDLKELQYILRNAPITLSEGILDPECHNPISLAYMYNPNFADILFCDEINESGIDGIRLSDRKFHRCIQVLVDTTEVIPRDYEEAIECGWDVSNNNGESVIGRDQLVLKPDFARTLEIYSDKSSGEVVVVYNQKAKDYLISLKFFNRENFHYIPRTPRNDSGGEPQ